MHLKHILRTEGQNVGIQKYGAGSRQWMATVCDGSPQKLFLGLVGELLFCQKCLLPVGDLQKHCQDRHDGAQLDGADLALEMDFILPLAGPGQVEKNLLTALVQVFWDLLGLDQFSKLNGVTIQLKDKRNICLIVPIITKQVTLSR